MIDEGNDDDKCCGEYGFCTKKKFENWGCIFKSMKILMDLKNMKKLKFS